MLALNLNCIIVLIILFFFYNIPVQDLQTAKGMKPILKNVSALKRNVVVKYAMLVYYWSKDILNCQLAQLDIGIMWQMLEVVLVLRVLSNQRNKKSLSAVVINSAEMKMILQKKSTKNISIEVKRSLQWSEKGIHLFQCQVFLICQDGQSEQQYSIFLIFNIL